MTAVSIGDLAQTFLLQRRSAELRQDMTRLSQEVTTGRVQDVSTKLGGDFARLSGVEHRLTVMSGLRTANAEAASFTEAAQLRLGATTNTIGDLGRSLLAFGSAPVADAVRSGADRAAQAFEDVVHQLNGFHAGRALFSGVTTDAVPLAPAQDILAALRTAATGAGSAAAALSAMDTWFTDPSGFAALGYLGGTSDLVPFAIDEERSVPFEIRADMPELRNALRNIAAAALADDPALGLSSLEQGILIEAAGARLLQDQDALIEVSATLGVTQELIEQAQVRQSAEQIILEQNRAALIAADPYQSATELETVQFQLESLYAITVRSSQLSLVNFLR